MFKEETLANKFVKKGFRSYGFMILIAPAAYIIKVFLSNGMTVEDVGLFFRLTAFVALLATINDLGLTESLQYYLPTYRIKKKYNEITTLSIVTLFFQFLSCALIWWAIYRSSDRLSVHFFHSPLAAPALKIFSFYFFVLNLRQVLWALFNAFQNILLQQLIDFIRVYGNLLSAIVLFFQYKLSILNLTIGRFLSIIIAAVVWSVLLALKYHRVFTRWRFSFDSMAFKEQLRYAFRVLLGTNIYFIFGQIDLQLVWYLLGNDASWYYSNYQSLLSSFTVILAPALLLLFPITTELSAKWEHDKLSQLVSLFYSLFLTIGFLLTICFLALWPEIAQVLFWLKFLYSWTLLQMGAIFIPVLTIFSINYHVFSGMGMAKERMHIILIALFIHLLLGVGLIFLFWLPGMLVAHGLSYAYIARQTKKIISHKLPKISIDLKFIGKNILVAGVLWWVIFVFKRYFIQQSDLLRFHNIAIITVILIVVGLFLTAVNISKIKSVIYEVNNALKSKNA